MAFTYDVSTNRGKVRFLLQDTTNTTARPALMQDDEVDFALGVEMNIYMAAALCADALSTRFRGASSKSVGGLSISYDPKLWEGIAARLRARGAGHMQMTAGGILVADRDAIWEDTDLLRPSFFSKLQQDTAPTVPSSSSEEFLP
ncbi:MAG TPA: hypothetical protein DCP69_12825 [Candidatus Omnitrophica bacterium]|nr:hypothetical protein [Candidatus Omnitrophota bacterium]